MADARIDITRGSDGQYVILAGCQGSRYGRFSRDLWSSETAYRDRLRHAVLGHIEQQCRPGGCPLHTLEVARE